MFPRDAHRALPERVGVREVLDLAWPVVVSMLSFSLMAAADVAIVGQLGTEPLASIGMALTLWYLLRAWPFGVISGVRVLTAQRMGAGDRDTVERLGWQGLWLAIAFGVLQAAFIPLARPALGWMGAEGAILDMASTFLVIRLAAAPVEMALLALTAWFQGRGDTRTPMVANVAANVANVALAAVLVLGIGPFPRLEMAGAALATNLATSLGLAVLLVAFVRRPTGVAPRPTWDLVRRAVGLGSALGLDDLLDLASYTLFVAVLAAAGPIHLAAHVLSLRINNVSALPGYALANATGVLVGHAVGAGRFDLARQAVRSGLALAVGLMAAAAVVFLAAPGLLLGVFGAEPEVFEVGRRLLAIAAVFQILDAVATVLYFALASAGDSRFALRVSVLASWGLRLPVAYALAHGAGLGAPGAWVGFVVQVGLLAAVFSWRVRSGGWLGNAEPTRADPIAGPEAVPARA